MRRIILFCAVTVAFLLAPSAFATSPGSDAEEPIPELPHTADCQESWARGDSDAAKYYKTAGWFLGGLAAGFSLVSAFPVGVAPVVGLVAGASASRPTPDALHFPDESEVDIACYLSGYRTRARKKSVNAVVLGGVLGAGAVVVVVVAAVYSYF